MKTAARSLSFVSLSLLIAGGCIDSDGAELGESQQALIWNDWMDRRDLIWAHRGGALEAPENTLYAFKTALQSGADGLELDVQRTRDGKLVVLHDSRVDRTTNGTGYARDKTLAELQALDAAYWFVPGRGTVVGLSADAYPYRGVATGQKQPPPGYTAADFRIPLLEDVLASFPRVFLVVEIKETAPDTLPYERDVAIMLGRHAREEDTIVASFYDASIEVFMEWALLYAPMVNTAIATVETALFWGSSQSLAPGVASPKYETLHVPITFEGVQVLTADFVQNAHWNYIAVQAWTLNEESEWDYALGVGVDGIITDRPAALHDYLCARGRGYGGTADCP